MDAGWNDDNIGGIEYLYFDGIDQYFITSFRFSLGDFQFDTVPYIDKIEGHYLYYITWTLCVFILNIIFLNFIVAELSNTYSEVSHRISAIRNYGKAIMINEVDSIFPDKYKNNKLYPKYVVIRDIYDKYDD